MIDSNNDGPLAGWVIALAHGRVFLGETHRVLVEGQTQLSPAYDLIVGMQMMQRHPNAPPELVTMRQVLPLLTYPGLKEIWLPANAILIPVADLETTERRDLARAVDGCEQMIASMRAAQSGLVLAPPGSRVKGP